MKYVLIDEDLEYLKKALYSIHNYKDEYPEESIMEYDKVCTCNSGALCEHRLEWIINFIKSKNR